MSKIITDEELDSTSEDSLGELEIESIIKPNGDEHETDEMRERNRMLYMEIKETEQALRESRQMVRQLRTLIKDIKYRRNCGIDQSARSSSNHVLNETFVKDISSDDDDITDGMSDEQEGMN
ncbi:hypothetical protein ACOME3_000411 [Neoechinorhynchus agilis]